MVTIGVEDAGNVVDSVPVKRSRVVKLPEIQFFDNDICGPCEIFLCQFKQIKSPEEECRQFLPKLLAARGTVVSSALGTTVSDVPTKLVK